MLLNQRIILFILIIFFLGCSTFKKLDYTPKYYKAPERYKAWVLPYMLTSNYIPTPPPLVIRSIVINAILKHNLTPSLLPFSSYKDFLIGYKSLDLKAKMVCSHLAEIKHLSYSDRLILVQIAEDHIKTEGNIFSLNSEIRIVVMKSKNCLLEYEDLLDLVEDGYTEKQLRQSMLNLYKKGTKALLHRILDIIFKPR